MRKLGLFAIRSYQKWLSPLKGYSCAYRVATGRASCSHLGYRAIELYGIVSGIKILKSRTELCGIAARRTRRIMFQYQTGECDPGCSPDCDMFSGASCDLSNNQNLNCLDGLLQGCNPGCGSSERKTPEEEAKVYIPPISK